MNVRELMSKKAYGNVVPPVGGTVPGLLGGAAKKNRNALVTPPTEAKPEAPEIKAGEKV